MVLAEDWEFPAVLRTRELAKKDQKIAHMREEIAKKDQELAQLNLVMANIRKAYRMYQKGYSVSKIAEELEVDPSIVKYWLSLDK